MPGLDRMYPDTPCQPNGAHHPHRYICNDPEDDCWDNWRQDKYEQFNILQCCVCGEEWPCTTKQKHQNTTG